MLRLILLFLLFQGAAVQPVSEKNIDDSYAILLARTTAPGKSTLQVRLIDRKDRNRIWELASFQNVAYGYEIVQTDRSFVVLKYADDYGFSGGFVKLFFDLGSKRLLKRVEFKDVSFGQMRDADVQRTLNVPREVAWRLKTPFEPSALPDELLKVNLPQSTLADYARARPDRQRPGAIEEKIEPYQVDGGRIWFGKSFYDGEGFSGVGGIGYLDRAARKLTFLRIPEVAGWSVSNLLVEKDTLWAGLVRHPEGADISGGLLRHDIKSGSTRKYQVDEVIFRITRWQDALYLNTSNGIYVLKSDRFERYRVQPDIDGKLTIVSEQL